jgi:hypothetical protein
MHFCGQDLDPDIEGIVAEQETGGQSLVVAPLWWFGAPHNRHCTGLEQEQEAGEGGHFSPHYHNITFISVLIKLDTWICGLNFYFFQNVFCILFNK